MPSTESPPIEPALHDDVMTLAQAAAYLQLTEDDLRELAEQNGVPAKKIGSEWRFLKPMLFVWLNDAPHVHAMYRRYGMPLFWDHPMMGEWLFRLEQRLAGSLPPADKNEPKGSRGRIMRHFGALKGEPGEEQLLASLYDLRSEKDGGVGE